ncbi:MAG: TIGR01777 family oxidoreductase, partial [Nitrospirae bacterium]|nr:TIGR01777 family oxidoreductase [Fimbriimonadaceae bacterium]
MSDRHVVIAWGAGFIGGALVAQLVASGYRCTVLSRSGRAVAGASGAVWDAVSADALVPLIEGAEAVVNLVGEPIVQRWNEDTKRRIVDSRVNSTRAVGDAIAKCSTPPRVWLNASGVGYYGDSGDRPLSEASPPGTDFPGRVAQLWEGACMEAATPQTRKVVVRIGFVLGRGGGALKPLVALTKAFMGSAIGTGRQYVSWIHLADLVRLFAFLIENDVHGPVNATAPTPVRQGELMTALRRHLG